MATHGGGAVPFDVMCSMYYYVAVLPGRSQTIAVTTLEGLGDPIPTLMIYGTLPPGITVSVVRYDTALACGAALSGVPAHPFNRIKDEQQAYYASDDRFSGQENHANQVFGLQITDPARGSRTIRIVADYPAEFVGSPPTDRRMDVTDDLAIAAFKSPPDTLLCL